MSRKFWYWNHEKTMTVSILGKKISYRNMQFYSIFNQILTCEIGSKKSAHFSRCSIHNAASIKSQEKIFCYVDVYKHRHHPRHWLSVVLRCVFIMLQCVEIIARDPCCFNLRPWVYLNARFSQQMQLIDCGFFSYWFFLLCQGMCDHFNQLWRV